jgi:cytochrome oxidase assembly protein ShyY1
MRIAAPRLFIPTVATLMGLAVLTGLGLWQVERLSWKENLIATLQRRIVAPPMELPASSDWPQMNQDNFEFRRVKATLEFSGQKPANVYASGSTLRDDIKAPGYFVFVPARLASGETIVVNAGYSADPRNVTPGRREITGYLRWPDRSSWFVAEHDATGATWFVRDQRAMARVRDWGTVAPFYIDQEGPLPPGGQPKPGPITVKLPNNHLGYALTWFGLAAALASVFFFWVRKQLRETGHSGGESVSL